MYLPHFLPNWDSYLHSQGRDGVWGDHLALLGASNLYNIDIYIVSSIPDSEPVVITPGHGISSQDIYLGHISETHHATLKPATEEGQTVGGGGYNL